MFDKFFEKHKPENEAVPSAESVGRINALLKGKLNETKFKEEKPMKKKSIIKRIMLVAAAAAAAASALIFSVTADNGDDEEYIVRINGKRVDAEITTYREGKIRFDTIAYELPCELFIDKDGKPVTEDSDVDRRVVRFRGEVYRYEDPEQQVYIPDVGVDIDRGFSGIRLLYENEAMKLPVAYEDGSDNILLTPAVINVRYDEEAVKEFWENYWKDPENESKELAEYFKERSARLEAISKPEPDWGDEFNDLYYERVIKKYGLE